MSRRLAGAIAATLLSTGITTTASADDFGFSLHIGRGGYACDPGYVVYDQPVVYAPPVVYYDAPVYYAPAPRVIVRERYAPAYYRSSCGPVYRGGYSRAVVYSDRGYYRGGRGRCR